ncbi:hypothetical protein QCA50_012239 [Cerrena zonata]|uniref:Uncharacterized protein n=1 Tax=Cerrena zonata TaxID=2478898 RepID=A0AAW0FUW6_9APHY
MSYYDPFQGIPQQYMAQSYYPPQFYAQQGSDDQLVNPDGMTASIDSRPSSYDQQYPQYQSEAGFNFNGVDMNAPSVNANGHQFYSGAPTDESTFLESQNVNGAYQGQYPPGSNAAQVNGGAGIPSGNLSNVNLIPGTPNGQNNDIIFGANGTPTPQQSGGPNGSVAPSRTVYLGNIPSDIQPNELLDYVSTLGISNCLSS